MPARKAVKPSSPPPSAPRRMTRSRAASQGLEMPTGFHTPPDAVRRPRKTSKASQESVAEQVVAEEEMIEEQGSVEDVKQKQQEQGQSTHKMIEEAGHKQEVVSISSDSASEDESSEDDADADANANTNTNAQPSQAKSKTDISLLSELGTPENESTPVSQLAYASSPVVQVKKQLSLHMPPPLRKTLSPTTKRRQAINSSPRLPPPRQTIITLRQESLSPQPSSPEPISRKRPRSQSHESAVASASNSESEDDDDGQARVITYTPKPLSGEAFNRFKRVRRVLGNNALEQRAYDISIQRMADWNREHNVPPTNTRLASSNTDNHQSSSSQSHLANAAIQHESTSNATQSAPTTPTQSRVGTILNPLLHSASKMFNLFGSRSAAPKLNTSNVNAQPASATPPKPTASQSEQPPVDIQDAGKTPDHTTPSAPDDDQSLSTVFTPSRRPTPARRPLTRRNPARLRHTPRRTVSKEKSAEPETTSDSNKSRKINHVSHPDSRINNHRHEEHVNSFAPDETQEQGQKRKLNVGKTFSMPDDPDSGASDTTSPPPSPPSQTSRVILPATAPSSRVGKTFSMPDTSISTTTDSEESFSVLDLPYKKKQVSDFTEQDTKDYMRMEHGFDPVGLAAEIPKLLQGAMPEMFMRARLGIRAIEEQAQQELDSRMKVETERRMINMERYALEYEEYLHRLKVDCHQYESLRDAQANAAQLAKEVENQSPSQPRQFDDSSNIFQAAHARDAQTPKSNVTWTENKENHVTSPGPNQPPKYASDAASTSAAKSALKQANDKVPTNTSQILPEFMSSEEARGLSGRQLESYESQLSGINKYHPKQPSRLREVSRLSSSPAGSLQSPANQQHLIPPSTTVGSESPIDTSMYTVSDISCSPGFPAGFETQPEFTTPEVPSTTVTGDAVSASPEEPWLFGAFDLPGKASVREAVLQAMQSLPPSPFYGAGLVIDTSVGLSPTQIETRLANVMAAVGS